MSGRTLAGKAQTPEERAERNRVTAKAQSRALHELARRHPEEYDVYYRFYLADLGYEPLYRRTIIPTPPPFGPAS